jgi:hypothetical protein
MEAFVAALDRTTITPVARVRPLQFRRLAPLLSSAAEVLGHGLSPFPTGAPPMLCCWGPRGIRAREISTLHGVLRRPPLTGLQQFSLREDL